MLKAIIQVFSLTVKTQMSRYPWEIGSLKAMVYCKCGEAMEVRTSSIDDLIVTLEAFAGLHKGEGHGPCGANVARRARKRWETRNVRQD